MLKNSDLNGFKNKGKLNESASLKNFYFEDDYNNTPIIYELSTIPFSSIKSSRHNYISIGSTKSNLNLAFVLSEKIGS